MRTHTNTQKHKNTNTQSQRKRKKKTDQRINGPTDQSKTMIFCRFCREAVLVCITLPRTGSRSNAQAMLGANSVAATKHHYYICFAVLARVVTGGQPRTATPTPSKTKTPSRLNNDPLDQVKPLYDKCPRTPKRRRSPVAQS